MCEFKPKRNRLPNFTEGEEKCLVELAGQYIHVIESKKTDAKTWKKKRYCWEQIDLELERRFGLNRGAKNIKEKYDNLKRKLKKNLDDEHKTQEDDVTKRLAAILNAAGNVSLNDFNDDAGVSIEYEDESYLENDTKEGLNIELGDHIIQDMEPQRNEEPSSDVFSWKTAQRNDDKTSPQQTSKNENNKSLLTDPRDIFYKNEELRSAENHRLAAERHKWEVEKLRWELKTAKLKAKTLKQKLEQSPLVMHGSLSPPSVIMCDADPFQMELSMSLNMSNNFAAQSPVIKMEPPSELTNTSANDDVILPDTINTHNKRLADVDPNGQTNKRLRQHTHGFGDEQQQWDVALRNDVLYVNNSSESARLPAASTSEFDSDNGYNDDGNDHEAAGGLSSKHLQANDENIGSGFLKLLTKHKLQNYYVKLKEINIDLDCLKYIRETDIKDIFEKDIGGRIRFRGLVEEWRTKHLDFNGVLHNNIGSYARDDDVVTKRDIAELKSFIKDAQNTFFKEQQRTQQNPSQRFTHEQMHEEDHNFKEVLPRKQFQTVFDFKVFEESLRNSDEAYTNLIRELIDLTAKDSVSFVKSAWRRIMSDNVAKHFCWTGTPEKPAIRELRVTNALREAYHRKYKYASADEFQRTIIAFFQFAKVRLQKKESYEKTKACTTLSL